MIIVRGNDFWRAGEKIGWIQNGHDIYDHNGKKLGYFSGGKIYDHDNRRLAFAEGDYFYSGNKKIRLENISEHVAGDVPEIARAAIYVLLGD